MQFYHTNFARNLPQKIAGLMISWPKPHIFPKPAVFV
jgi:hypothetical protein